MASKLKLKVDSSDDIPSGLESFYEEQDDGSFRLNVEGVKSDDDVKSVKDALDKERKSRRDAEKRAKEAEDKLSEYPDDLSPDEIESLRANGSNQDIQAKIDEARERERKRWEKKLQDEQEARQNAENQARSLTTKQALKEGLDSINVASKLRRAAERVWMSDVEIDDDGNAVTKDGRPLQDALKEWADSEEGQHFIAAPSSGGGGAAGGRGSAKGKKFSEMTEQEHRELYRRDPAEYRRLRDQEKQ
jgi:chromosome segregation ATPase